MDTYIALVTEPFCYKQKLSLPPKNSVIIPNKREGHPRAAIFCSKNLLLSELDHLGNRDMAVGLITLDKRKVILISLYCDIKKDTIQQDLLNVMEYSKAKGYAALIAAPTRIVLYGAERQIKEARILKNLSETMT